MDSRNPYVKLLAGLVCIGVPIGVLPIVGLIIKNNGLLWGGVGLLIAFIVLWIHICFPRFWKTLFKGPDAE